MTTRSADTARAAILRRTSRPHRQQGNGAYAPPACGSGLLHPGEMGAAIGELVAGHGHDVLWAADGRGAHTRARASAFTELPTVAAVAGASDLDLLGLPSARRARGRRRGRERPGSRACTSTPTPSPRAPRARWVASSRTPARPSSTAGSSAAHRPAARARGSTSPGTAHLRSPSCSPTRRSARSCSTGEPGAASALKVCYAAYTKGTTALLLAIRSLARAEGVDDALLAEWADLPTGPGRALGGRPAAAARGRRGGSRARWTRSPTPSPTRAYPDGFHRGAAETYRRLDRFKDSPEPPALADLIAEVLADVHERPVTRLTNAGSAFSRLRACARHRGSRPGSRRSRRRGGRARRGGPARARTRACGARRTAPASPRLPRSCTAGVSARAR